MSRVAALTLLCLALTVSLVSARDGLAVTDAKLGTGVTDRELTGETTTFNVGDTVYLWLNVTGGPADAIKVNWKLGDFVDTVSLPIGAGDRWRTWSTKTAFKAGDWTVSVTDASGTSLKELTFTVK